jgi:hypothetical protein
VIEKCECLFERKDVKIGEVMTESGVMRAKKELHRPPMATHELIAVLNRVAPELADSHFRPRPERVRHGYRIEADQDLFDEKTKIRNADRRRW